MGAKDDKELERYMLKMGKRLKEIRKKQYSNYEHFVYEHGFNRVQYGRYENGKDIRMTTFLKILKALKVSPKEFFSEGFE